MEKTIRRGHTLEVTDAIQNDNRVNLLSLSRAVDSVGRDVPMGQVSNYKAYKKVEDTGLHQKELVAESIPPRSNLNSPNHGSTLCPPRIDTNCGRTAGFMKIVRAHRSPVLPIENIHHPGMQETLETTPNGMLQYSTSSCGISNLPINVASSLPFLPSVFFSFFITFALTPCTSACIFISSLFSLPVFFQWNISL